MKEELNFCRNGAGDYIKKELASRGWSQNDLAEIAGLSTKTVNQIINNKQIMTPVNAIILGSAFDTNPELWLNLDAKYQIMSRENKEAPKAELTEIKARLQAIMPFAEIKNKGWFSTEMKTLEEIKKGIFDFFKSNIIPEKLDGDSLRACARRTRTDNDYTERNCNAWFTFAKYFSQDMIVSKFDSKGFKKIANGISKYTLLHNGPEKFIKDLQSVGVGFFILKHLEKTYLDGAAFLRGNNPFIVYTGRYNRIDNFWFVMAHECGHISNDFEYMKQGSFLDDLDLKASEKDEREIMADAFANGVLKHDSVVAMGHKFGRYLSEERLKLLSVSNGVSVPVALGILQHEGIVDWRKFSRFREPVLDLIPDCYKKGKK